MSFGLHRAPVTFQHLMDQVLKGISDFSAAYLDDVIIFSGTWEDHLFHVGQVLKQSLTVNSKKCTLAQVETKYLGYVLGNRVIRPQVEKLEAIKSCSPTTTKKMVRSFLGLVGWYRRFIPNFSSKAAVLTDLTKKSRPNKIIWTEPCDKPSMI